MVDGQMDGRWMVDDDRWIIDEWMMERWIIGR